MTRVSKFLALPSPDRRLLLRALMPLTILRAGLWMLPFPRVLSLVERWKRPGAAPAHSAHPAPEKLAWAVRAASAAIPGGRNCLLRALAMQVMLGRAGHASELRLGVARPGEAAFAAHAWVECAGKIVMGEDEAAAYVPLRPSAAERTSSGLTSRPR
jgi:hypothetical protein